MNSPDVINWNREDCRIISALVISEIYQNETVEKVELLMMMNETQKNPRSKERNSCWET
jgi:hypothetical protein